MTLFVPMKVVTHIEMKPSELDAKLEERLRAKLQAKMEGMCNTFGYVKPGSLQILKRSFGRLQKAHFNAHVRYTFVCKVEVCNPPLQSVISAVVKNKNQMGILAESGIDIDGDTYRVMEIIVPRKSAGIVSEVDLDALRIGDTVHVEIMGKRYQLFDQKIFICGRIVRPPAETTEDVKLEFGLGNALDTDAADDDEEVFLDEDADDDPASEDESEDGEARRPVGAALDVEVAGESDEEGPVREAQSDEEEEEEVYEEDEEEEFDEDGGASVEEEGI